MREAEALVHFEHPRMRIDAVEDRTLDQPIERLALAATAQGRAAVVGRTVGATDDLQGGHVGQEDIGVRLLVHRQDALGQVPHQVRRGGIVRIARWPEAEIRRPGPGGPPGQRKNQPHEGATRTTDG